MLAENVFVEHIVLVGFEDPKIEKVGEKDDEGGEEDLEGGYFWEHLL